MQSFYKSFGILCGIIFWILLTLQLFFPHIVALYSWVLFAYLAGLTALSYYLINKGLKTQDAFDFYNASMGSTAIRLLLSGTVLFIYFYFYKDNQIHFAVTFFSLYFAFTIFEINALLKNMKNK
jgi:hypothetical protein